MHLALLVPEYIAWHYTEAVRLSLNIITNFLWFTYHFFSIPVLARSLFKPFAGHIGLVLVGVLLRLVVIVSGIVFCSLVVFAGAIIFVLWLLLPFIALALLYFGFAFFI